MAYKSVHLIANKIIINETLPFEIGKVLLRRPTDIELDKIRNVLGITDDEKNYHWLNHESIIDSIEGEQITFSRTDDSSAWRYYVLSDDVGGNAVHNIAAALLLLEPSIELSVRLTSDTNRNPAHLGYSSPSPHIYERYYYFEEITHPTLISLAQFKKADEVRDKLNQLDEKYEFIRYAMKTLEESRRIPLTSRLQVIGLFSIVENLITHSPRLKESLDSISHQLRGKLHLLSNMTNSHEIVSKHFNNVAATEVWKKLYEYRSRLAHGSKADFSGKLTELKSNDNVVQFLYSFTKVLLLFALENPQFMADLKEC